MKQLFVKEDVFCSHCHLLVPMGVSPFTGIVGAKLHPAPWICVQLYAQRVDLKPAS